MLLRDCLKDVELESVLGVLSWSRDIDIPDDWIRRFKIENDASEMLWGLCLGEAEHLYQSPDGTDKRFEFEQNYYAQRSQTVYARMHLLFVELGERVYPRP